MILTIMTWTNSKKNICMGNVLCKASGLFV